MTEAAPRSGPPPLGTVTPVSIVAAFAAITETWSPVVIGELNGQQVKAVKLQGTFHFHAHAREDELFFVHRGELRMDLRAGSVRIKQGEFYFVPAGVEHCPVADEMTEILLFEPASTVREGDVSRAE
jgi:mannose-6-phosphate isomerase-like protein (cupin superfamily)